MPIALVNAAMQLWLTSTTCQKIDDKRPLEEWFLHDFYYFSYYDQGTEFISISPYSPLLVWWHITCIISLDQNMTTSAFILAHGAPFTWKNNNSFKKWFRELVHWDMFFYKKIEEE